LLDFYLATAAGVYAIERPGDRLVDHLEPTEYPGLRFKDRQEALDWLYSEANCLLASARQALRGARLRRGVDLLWAAKDLGESGANSKQYESTALAARDAAQASADTQAEGRARTALTNVHLVAGRYGDADEEARLAGLLAATAGDPTPVFWTSNDRGIIALNQGRYTDAEQHLIRAIEASRQDGNLAGEASALCNLSRVHLAMGRTNHAIALAEQGIALYDRLGATVRLANARYALGLALTEAGRPAEALGELTEALNTFQMNRQRLWEGTTHFRIAQAHLVGRHHTLAAKHAEQALAVGCIGGDRVRAGVLTTLGRSLAALGQIDRARVCWLEALPLHEQSGSPEADAVRALLSPLSAA
jgi:tetratricopeptide (TPR) repeat protein